MTSGFEPVDFSGSTELCTSDTGPIEFTGVHEVTLTQLPFRVQIQAQPGYGCAIELPGVVDGQGITLFSATGNLELDLTDVGISFTVPSGDQAMIATGFTIGNDIVIRPMNAAPALPLVCQHGITPVSLCPLNPP